MAGMKTKTKIGIAVVVLVIGSLFAAAYRHRRHQYPLGSYHRCDKQLHMALREYADTHDGRFPSGEATPEASLSLLGSDYGYLLVRRGESVEVVEEMLERGELLGPETCGWNYVEGLSVDSNHELALFWDKEGLSEVGRRLPEGGHYVSFVGQAYSYIPASEWDNFLEGQRKLLAEEKAKTRGAPGS